jgi:class 3 adenylate cyclase
VSDSEFQPNQTYENVFLIFVDAAGHSNVVASNPRDLVYRAMDLLHSRLVTRLATIAGRRRCARAKLWRWAGDGGFLVVHDEDESVARDTAMEFTRQILEIDLPHLRVEFAELGVAGQLSLRVGLHRGVVRYRGEGLEGSIYSPDINFAAHLERAAPPDTALVSAEAQQIAGDFASALEPLGHFENRPVYLFAPGLPRAQASAVWLAARGLTGASPITGYHERPSQQDKARFISAAQTEVIDLGTALRTAAHYLVTTERPTYYRDAVLRLLRNGGRYRCVLMDPASPATALLTEQRGEELTGKIGQALADLRRFRQQIGADGEGLEVYLLPAYPGMACLTADLQLPHGLILTSPYLMPVPGGDPATRADMPHYLLSRSAGRLYDNLRDLITGFVGATAERVL